MGRPDHASSFRSIRPPAFSGTQLQHGVAVSLLQIAKLLLASLPDIQRICPQRIPPAPVGIMTQLSIAEGKRSNAT